MQRIKIETGTAISSGAATAVLVSIEGGNCRLYTGSVPSNALAGHAVSGGYQIVIPAGVSVYATASAASEVHAVVGEFGA